MFPVDLPALFQRELEKQKRPNDGKLHASSDLAGSLRHSQLRLADAPLNARAIASDIRMQHGTLWHEWFHDALERNGVPFFHEIKLDSYMPEGWSGTADWVFWHPDYKAFVLGDLKTARGEAMYWIGRDGAKKEHIWQLSAYFYALLDMGFPMVKGFGIMYWPMNDTSDKELVLPTVQECDPLPREQVYSEMNTRWDKSQKYLGSLKRNSPVTTYLTDSLAPPMEREQKLFWNKGLKVFDVKLMPHWSSKFCPYPNELCDCSEQGTNKIGHYMHITSNTWGYEARKGYEGIRPEVEPSKTEKQRRLKEVLADG